MITADMVTLVPANSIEIAFITVALVMGVIFLIGFQMWALKYYHKVKAGKALIVTKRLTRDVTFRGTVVIPILWASEEIDLRTHQIDVELTGRKNVAAQDGVPFHVSTTVYVRISENPSDILRVAETIGCERASDPEYVKELMVPQIEAALVTAAGTMAADEIISDRERYHDEVIKAIGQNLNGFTVDDVAVRDLRKKG